MPGGQVRTVIFACDGNTCRSPIAAAAARRVGAVRGPDGWSIGSAGIRAVPGAKASDEARAAAAALGLDLADHRATPLGGVVDDADLIVVMEAHQRAIVRSLRPEVAVVTLASTDIADPWGRGPSTYRRTARTIVDAVRERLPTLLAAV